MSNCYIPGSRPGVIFAQQNIIEVWKLELGEVREAPKLYIFEKNEIQRPV